MKYNNADSFKAKIKNIAKDKGIPAQQVQQNYLIEQVLRLIAQSRYNEYFIVKGGYLISNIIGIDKRTTMDLDVTLNGADLTQENLIKIFKEVLSDMEIDGFKFKIDSLAPIRRDDIYGGFEIKINVMFDTLREVVFIDVTTGDKITPKEIKYCIKSIFSDDEIHILSYNIETAIAEKLETVLSRGIGSTRPRDRYDLFTLWKLCHWEIDIKTLSLALVNTAGKRGSMEVVKNWTVQISEVRESDYQKQLWAKYQRSFKYASEISFEDSCKVVSEIMDLLEFSPF